MNMRLNQTTFHKQLN